MTYRQAMHLRRLVCQYTTEATRRPLDLFAFGHALDMLNAYINKLTVPKQSDRPDQRNALGEWGNL